MTIVSIISFSLFFVLLFSMFKKNSAILSPARIFLMVWVFCLGLAEFKFSRLQFEWSPFGYFVLLLGVGSFAVGIYISYVTNFSKKFLSVGEVRMQIRAIAIDESRFFNLLIGGFCIYFFSYLTQYFLLGYLPLFTPQPDLARKMFGTFGISLLVNGINAILFLVIEYFVLVKNQTKKKILLSFLGLVGFASFLLLLQRYNFVILGFMIVAFLFYSGKKIKPKTFFIFFAVIISLVFLIKGLRSAKFAEIYFYYLAQMKFPIAYAWLSEPYMYLVMNFENFVKNFSRIEFHSFGYFSFDFITALTGLKKWIGEYFFLEKFPFYISGYNTFPFYWAYFYDFGYLGLVIIPLFLGWIVSEIFYLLHRRPSLMTLSLYSAAFSVIVISYTSDPLTRLDMMFNYVMIVIAQKIILPKQQFSEQKVAIYG